MTRVIGLLVGRQVATLRELEEYYSVEDAYKMAEILQVDGYNKAQAQKES